MKNDFLISVLAVLENDCETIEDFVRETSQVLSTDFIYYEIVLIDNCSQDFTDQKIVSLQATIPNLRLIRLSRKHDLETALAAGLENSLGDYAVIIDVNSDPPILIPKLIETAVQGSDVVIAIRKNRENQGIARRYLAIIFYKIASNLLGYSLQPNATHFRVLSRQVVNSLIRIGNKNRYLKYLNALVGFKQTHVEYQKIYRSNCTKKDPGIFRLIISGIDLIISNSPAPLRLASLLGFIASGVSLLYCCYVVAVTLIKQKIAEGWITTNLMTSAMFFLLFLILSILSEYIARILDETKDHPLYFIEYESQSVVTSFHSPIVSKAVNVV